MVRAGLTYDAPALLGLGDTAILLNFEEENMKRQLFIALLILLTGMIFSGPALALPFGG